MKLHELKTSLVEQFFNANSEGVSSDLLPQIFQELRDQLKNAPLLESLTCDFHSFDPSKAFRQFTKDPSVILTISEGPQKVLFAAAKQGTQVVSCDLTQETRSVVKSDLSTVKSALRQAKHFNDEVDYNIISQP